MSWGIIHADGYEEVSDVVTTRQSARDWAQELNEDCDCGGRHRVFGRDVVLGAVSANSAAFPEHRQGDT